MQQSQISKLVVVNLLLIIQSSWADHLFHETRSRHSRQRQHSVRFGYQNPVLVAPTLPPVDNRPYSPYSTGRPHSGFGEPWDSGFSTTSFTPTESDLFPCLTGYKRNHNGKSVEVESQWQTSKVRFGHQNPILIAPTLSPTSSSFYTTTPRNGHSNTHWSRPVINDPNGNGQRKCPPPYYRRDRNTDKCFLIGSTEPCGGKERNMAFYTYPNDSVYGECDCNQNTRRPLAYHPPTDTCYYIYQQAYCRPQDWLVFDPEGYPVCQPNPCREYGEHQLKWDWTSNSDMLYMNTEGIVPFSQSQQCVPLGFVCRCGANGGLSFLDDRQRNDKFVLSFQSGHLQPTCNFQKRQLSQYDLLTNLNFHCGPGSKLFLLGKCQSERHFSYQNKIDTSSSTGIHTKTLQCGGNQKGYDTRLDRKTQQPYQLGSNRPCGGLSKNMVFYADPSDQIHGECDCVKQKNGQRPLVYHPQTDTCYFVYQQAYCSSGSWLKLDTLGDPTCVPNSCLRNGETEWDWQANSNVINTKGFVEIEGTCDKLGSTSECHKDKNWDEGLTPVVTFVAGRYQPTCDVNKIHLDLDHNPQDVVLECRPGSKLKIENRCTKPYLVPVAEARNVANGGDKQNVFLIIFLHCCYFAFTHWCY